MYRLIGYKCSGVTSMESAETFVGRRPMPDGWGKCIAISSDERTLSTVRKTASSPVLQFLPGSRMHLTKID